MQLKAGQILTNWEIDKAMEKGRRFLEEKDRLKDEMTSRDIPEGLRSPYHIKTSSAYIRIQEICFRGKRKDGLSKR